MKRIIGIILLLFVTMSASAQMWGHSAHGNSFGYGRNSSDGYLSKGYRGMVEMGFGGAVSSYEKGGPLFKISTTHGYQFNPYVYLGGFVSLGTTEVECWYLGGNYPNCEINSNFNFRIGADFRAYISKGRFAPFVGLQLGFDYAHSPNYYYTEYIYNDYKNVYLSANLGLRVAIKNRMGLNLGVQVGSEYYFKACEVLFKLGYEF